MGEIVLALGCSHSPLLTLDADMWIQRAADDLRNEALNLSDGRFLSYSDLLAERGPVYAAEAQHAVLQGHAEKAQRLLSRMALEIEEAHPDVVVVIGDDQEELFKAGNTPSLAIYYGDEVIMRPLGKIVKTPPDWMREALEGYAMETDHRFPGAPEIGLKLIEGLMNKDIDTAVVSSIEDPGKAAFGHAYGFIARRLFGGKPIPILPILLNTYYPPNVIRPGRCYDIGKAISEVIAEMPGSVRVAVVASGGLSHFVTDSELDQKVLEALKNGDSVCLRHLPMSALNGGSSEILCWVMLGGITRLLTPNWSEYIPVFRTPAGSGIGLAFATWGPS